MKRCGDIGIMLFSLNGRENAHEKNVLFFKPVGLLFIIHIHVFRNKGLVTFITNVDRILTVALPEKYLYAPTETFTAKTEKKSF